jgi:hypothetical protein
VLWLLCGPELGVCLEVRDEVFARGVAAAFLTLFAYKFMENRSLSPTKDSDAL